MKEEFKKLKYFLKFYIYFPGKFMKKYRIIKYWKTYKSFVDLVFCYGYEKEFYEFLFGKKDIDFGVLRRICNSWCFEKKADNYPQLLKKLFKRKKK